MENCNVKLNSRKILYRDKIFNLFREYYGFNDLYSFNINIMFGIMVCITTKWVFDQPYSNKSYAMVLCIDLKLFNKVESLLLQMFDYNFKLNNYDEQYINNLFNIFKYIFK